MSHIVLPHIGVADEPRRRYRLAKGWVLQPLYGGHALREVIAGNGAVYPTRGDGAIGTSPHVFRKFKLYFPENRRFVGTVARGGGDPLIVVHDMVGEEPLCERIAIAKELLRGHPLLKLVVPQNPAQGRSFPPEAIEHRWARGRRRPLVRWVAKRANAPLLSIGHGGKSRAVSKDAHRIEGYMAWCCGNRTGELLD